MPEWLKTFLIIIGVSLAVTIFIAFLIYGVAWDEEQDDKKASYQCEQLARNMEPESWNYAKEDDVCWLSKNGQLLRTEMP